MLLDYLIFTAMFYIFEKNVPKDSIFTLVPQILHTHHRIGVPDRVRVVTHSLPLRVEEIVQNKIVRMHLAIG